MHVTLSGQFEVGLSVARPLRITITYLVSMSSGTALAVLAISAIEHWLTDPCFAYKSVANTFDFTKYYLICILLVSDSVKPSRRYIYYPRKEVNVKYRCFVGCRSSGSYRCRWANYLSCLIAGAWLNRETFSGVHLLGLWGALDVVQHPAFVNVLVFIRVHYYPCQCKVGWVGI